MGWSSRLYRSMMLSLAGNPLAERMAIQYGMRLGASRFIAGEKLEAALDCVEGLNAKGISATLDHLGEGIAKLSEAEDFVSAYDRLLAGIQERALDATISLKPSQLGLALDAERCYENIRTIVSAARWNANIVTIDMEDSRCTETTIGFVRRLHAEGLDNVGTVLQAYLYRSAEDLETLTRERVHLRLVKGAYKEPKRLAYLNKSDVDRRLLEMIERRLRSDSFTAIATHDERIIDAAIHFAAKNEVARDRFEFQMLYGVRTQLQDRLASEGYGVRCYVPYGRMWYPYFVRRLAERPANVIFILRNLFRR